MNPVIIGVLVAAAMGAVLVWWWRARRPPDPAVLRSLSLNALPDAVQRLTRAGQGSAALQALALPGDRFDRIRDLTDLSSPEAADAVAQLLRLTLGPPSTTEAGATVWPASAPEGARLAGHRLAFAQLQSGDSAPSPDKVDLLITLSPTPGSAPQTGPPTVHLDPQTVHRLLFAPDPHGALTGLSALAAPELGLHRWRHSPVAPDIPRADATVTLLFVIGPDEPGRRMAAGALLGGRTPDQIRSGVGGGPPPADPAELLTWVTGGPASGPQTILLDQVDALMVTDARTGSPLLRQLLDTPELRVVVLLSPGAWQDLRTAHDILGHGPLADGAHLAFTGPWSAKHTMAAVDTHLASLGVTSHEAARRQFYDWTGGWPDLNARLAEAALDRLRTRGRLELQVADVDHAARALAGGDLTAQLHARLPPAWPVVAYAALDRGADIDARLEAIADGLGRTVPSFVVDDTLARMTDLGLLKVRNGQVTWTADLIQHALRPKGDAKKPSFADLDEGLPPDPRGWVRPRDPLVRLLHDAPAAVRSLPPRVLAHTFVRLREAQVLHLFLDALGLPADRGEHLAALDPGPGPDTLVALAHLLGVSDPAQPEDGPPGVHYLVPPTPTAHPTLIALHGHSPGAPVSVEDALNHVFEQHPPAPGWPALLVVGDQRPTPDGGPQGATLDQGALAELLLAPDPSRRLAAILTDKSPGAPQSEA